MKTCGTSEAACIVMLEVYAFALSFICIWLLSVHTWFYILVYLIVCLELQEQQELQNKTESVLNLTLTKWN